MDKLELLYGKATAQKIAESNVLVVGAGGIGCEVMKTLSLTGFQRLTVIDLDTIDVSNLNRQFLFRREHVDKSKAEVLRDQIAAQNPHVSVQAFVGRIQVSSLKEERFGYRFFSQFQLVVNALDNEEARKHVNLMCFNLNLPLVDSGTNGYAAQCIPIMKAVTPCYQCVDRPKDQSFPVCTIRQKPEKMIHCIVWAKALFEGLFGAKENSNNIIQDIVEEIHHAGKAASDPVTQAGIIFDKVFLHEVQTLRDNLSTRQEMTPDEALFLEKVKVFEFASYRDQVVSHLEDTTFLLNQTQLKDQQSLKALPVPDSVYLFVKSLADIHRERADSLGSLVFNKDDDLCIAFVAAAANLRAANFSIPPEVRLFIFSVIPQSEFKIKEMAGKIIPAISSSNALVAALQVAEGIKLLSGRHSQLQGIFYQRLDKVRVQAFSRGNDVKNAECQVCSDDTKHIYSLDLCDTKAQTLRELVQEALIPAFGQQMLIEVCGNIVYEQGDDVDEDDQEIYNRRLTKSLFDLKIRDLSILNVQGSVDSVDCTVIIQVFESPALPGPFKLSVLKRGGPPTFKPTPKAKPTGDLELSDSDDLEMDEEAAVGMKRKSTTSVEDPTKRVKRD